MAGFGMILGGAIEGYGKGIVEDAKAKREAALEELRFQRQRQMAGDAQQFQAGENEKSRDFSASQNEANRTFTSTEADKGRTFTAGENATTRADSNDHFDRTLEQQQSEADARRASEGTPATGADGKTYSVRGGTATPITDPDGNPVQLSTTSKDAKPSDVATAEWLVSKNVAKNMAEAWNMVKAGVKANPTSMDVEKMANDRVKLQYGDSFGTKKEVIDTALNAARADIRKQFGLDNEDGSPASSSSSTKSSDQKPGTPDTYSAGTKYPTATKESISSLTEGKIYSTPAGDLRYVGPNRWAKP